MKKLVLLLLCLSFSVQLLNTASESVCNKTFFVPRALSDDAVFLHMMSHHFMYRTEPAPQFFLHMGFFAHDATNHKDITRYLFPDGKCELTVKGALAEGNRDISATWLQIAAKNRTNPAGQDVPTELGFTGDMIQGMTTRADVELYVNEFASKITMNPTYRNIGALFQLYHNLDWLTHRLWCSLDIPVVQVETDPRLCETDILDAADFRGNVNDFVITDGAGDVQRHERARLGHMLSVKEAFNNPLWKYGKISDHQLLKAGFSDLQFKLGYHLLRFTALRLNMFGRISIPTGHKPTAEYLFEPILGNGGHWGLGTGVSIDATLVSGKKFNVSCSAVVDYIYLFETTQRRSMDLVNNGPWSRYLLVVDTKNEQMNTKRTLQPGINLFTRDVGVRPHHDLNALGSLRVGKGVLFFEGGYNFWLRSAETLCLKDGLPEGIALAGTNFGANTPDDAFQIQTFSKATIVDHIVNPTDDSPMTPVTLQSSDLSLASATHPKRISHKIFVASGVTTTWGDSPVQVGIGGSYEFGQKNRSLDLWGVFFKINVLV